MSIPESPNPQTNSVPVAKKGPEYPEYGFYGPRGPFTTVADEGVVKNGIALGHLEQDGALAHQTWDSIVPGTHEEGRWGDDHNSQENDDYPGGPDEAKSNRPRIDREGTNWHDEARKALARSKKYMTPSKQGSYGPSAPVSPEQAAAIQAYKNKH